MAMDRLFQLMKEKNASDMFFAVNSPVHIKINGNLIPINQQKLEPENIHALLAEIATPEQMEELAATNELNMGVSVPNLGRFRLSAFKQRGTISAVFRFVPATIPLLADLQLPPVLADLIMEKRGLLLLVGSTGSGKSTTIAAMLDHRNELRSGHILTLEDPIEYLFRNKKSIVNQREIGSDAKDFYTALRNSMRQAPDCILIGEIRDKETMAAAWPMRSRATWCWPRCTNNSYNALNRIISFYPIENRPALCCRTWPRPEPSSPAPAAIGCAASARPVEVMLNTRHISELIEQGEIVQIRDAMEQSLSPGSQTFEQALLKLLQQGLISQDEALAHADSATNLLWLLNNGPIAAHARPAGRSSTSGGLLQRLPAKRLGLLFDLARQFQHLVADGQTAPARLGLVDAEGQPVGLQHQPDDGAVTERFRILAHHQHGFVAKCLEPAAQIAAHAIAQHQQLALAGPRRLVKRHDAAAAGQILGQRPQGFLHSASPATQ
jgi:twitching motility protein PilU